MRTRFVLLTSPRTGSNLVSLALAAHPAVFMRGELFHPDEAQRKAWQQASLSFALPLQDYYRDGADPVAFLETHVYGCQDPAKQAAGFKLFYSHLRDGAAAHLWDWLAAERDIRIIHLHRKGLLEAYVSYAIATRTNEWLQFSASSSASAPVPPLTIDIEQLKRYIDETTRHFAQAEATFASHPLLTIEYRADVCGCFDETMRRIEQFLGIESMPLPKQIQKQARLPVSEEIANFHELHDALEGTSYEAYL